MLQPSINANWKKLLLVNYPIKKTLLEPFLPQYTEFALWNNSCYISLVGFLFLDVKFAGIEIPLHTNFVEINLRFYVRRRTNNEWKYGVVFLKEIVGLPMVSFVANTFFNEHYETMPVGYNLSRNSEELVLEYRWKKNEWNSIQIHTEPEMIPIEEGSQEDFFTEQHWGYTKLKNDSTREYSVLHPKWNMYKIKNYSINVDFGKVFGNQFNFLSNQNPESVFLAEGSEITLHKHTTIRNPKI
ncbi:MAG TPA: DUF2071 domain-containing protein [Saprospiraceae bacterium]|nr:DUF2071 domain-containing protein [Saprospiraceae bacterium]